ncbi:hypothetical protein M8C21_008821 [Ambrosia artemisiifolia]|uniref:RRM domain-containing protein n=1 Tax=Ambrosia artemisiifolia TaxID=4212 RepID=A0AAD5GDL5_AMBAR|nr:hypothetical protein M8C21_008821 [Ambrosia artemisiifolia]
MASSSNVEYQCYVGGLNFATTDQSLKQAFSRYGNILKTKIIKDRETGRSRGFGFVTFMDEQSMRDAIDSMNGQTLDGRKITVNKAQLRGNKLTLNDYAEPLIKEHLDIPACGCMLPINDYAVQLIKEHLNIVGPYKVHPNVIRCLGEDHGLDIIAMTQEELLQWETEGEINEE